MMTPKQIEAILRVGESESVEFKAGNVRRDQIARVVCGFLNSRGGHLFIGIDESSPGAMNYPKSDEEAEALVQWLRTEISPAALISGSVDQVNGGRLLVIDAPAGPDGPYVFDGTIHVREGTRTLPANSDQVSTVIQSRLEGQGRWENLPMLGVSLYDLDLGEIRQTVNEGQKRNRWSFSNPDDPAEALRDLGLMAGNQLNHAAWVLFGRDPSRNLPQLISRATRFNSEKTGAKYMQDKVFDGNLFSQFSKLVDFCEAQIDLPSEFVAGGWQREDRPMFPLEAVREGLLNALVHQDLSCPSGGLTLGLYPDRMEIWSYGKLPADLTAKALKTSHASLPRNPLIARVFFVRGLIEKIGRGTMKITERCHEFKMPDPAWNQHSGGTQLILKAKARGSGKALNVRQLQFLKTMRVGSKFSSQDYCREFGDRISSKTARNDLSALLDEGFVDRRGSSRSTYYEVRSIPVD